MYIQLKGVILKRNKANFMQDDMERLIRAKARRLHVSLDTIKDVIADRVVAGECDEDIASIVLSLTHSDIEDFEQLSKEWC